MEGNYHCDHHLNQSENEHVASLLKKFNSFTLTDSEKHLTVSAHAESDAHVVPVSSHIQMVPSILVRPYI